MPITSLCIIQHWFPKVDFKKAMILDASTSEKYNDRKLKKGITKTNLESYLSLSIPTPIHAPFSTHLLFFSQVYHDL